MWFRRDLMVSCQALENSNLILNGGQQYILRQNNSHQFSNHNIYYALDVFIRRLELVTFNKNIIIYICDWSYYPRAKAGDPLGDESLTGLNIIGRRDVSRWDDKRPIVFPVHTYIIYYIYIYIYSYSYNMYVIGWKW